MLALAAAASGVQAQPAPVERDLECLMALSALAGSDDQKTQTAAANAAMFFSGKLFGREPDIDLKARMLSGAKTFDRSTIPATLVRCGEEMKTRGSQLTDAGRYLQSQGY